MLTIDQARLLYSQRAVGDFHASYALGAWTLHLRLSDGNQTLQTARGKQKHYSTVEAVIKDIQAITSNRVATLSFTLAHG